MPPELTALIITAVLSAAVALTPILIWQKSSSNAGVFFVLLLALSLTGAIVGFFSGLSRVGVAGDVLPAALVFLAAGATYIYTLDHIEKAFVSSMAIVAFALSLGFEYYRAASIRADNTVRSVTINLQQQEIEAIRNQCLSFILSAEYAGLPRIEKLRTRAYCKPYVPFLN